MVEGGNKSVVWSKFPLKINYLRALHNYAVLGDKFERSNETNE